MPEMQLFGLPADGINAGAVATVPYLKAEDALGRLHDILGKYVALPRRTSTSFRFYIGAVQNIAATGTHARRLYLSVQNTSGQMTTTSTTIDATSALHRDMFVSGISSSPTYFELYIHSASGEKIVLSKGFTGGQ